MNNLKLTLLGCMVLLACVAALGLPAAASASGTITITGTVPLIIYDTQVSSITSHSATISWQTNGNATSQVFYDVKSHADTSAYAYHSLKDNALVLQHGVGLNGLSPSTTYHCRVESTIGGIKLVAVSPDFTFNTLPAHIPPGVITVGALPVGSTSALLWGILYNKGSASSVAVYFQWGTTTSYGHQTAQQTLTGPNIFLALATPLAPNTTYHFRAVAVGDGTSYGQDEILRTAKR